MAGYVAFLRAINLGAKRKFSKDAVAAATEVGGGTNVATWLNTGNVRLDSSRRSTALVAAELEQAYEEAAGFPVPTVVLTLRELRQVADDAVRFAAAHPEAGAYYVSLLQQDPDPATVTAFCERWNGPDHALVSGRAVHLLLAQRNNYHASSLNGDTVERAFGTATNRNARVIATVAEKWAS